MAKDEDIRSHVMTMMMIIAVSYIASHLLVSDI